MKTLIICIFTCSILQNFKAQVIFCPAGAEWHSTFISDAPYTVQNQQIKYVRDSIIGSFTAKVLTHSKFFNNGNNNPGNSLTLIRQNADTIFFRNLSTYHNWQILYNFAALPGQSWQTTIDHLNPANPSQPGSTYTITVDSIKFIASNSFNLKKMFVRYQCLDATSNIYTIAAEITERFGSHSFMFTYDGFFDSEGGDHFDSFLCYKDNSFGATQFTSLPCDYSDYVGLEEGSQAANVITFYPNPSSGKIHLSVPCTAGEQSPELSVFDISGREVKRLSLDGALQEQEIDLSDLKNGVYLLSLNRNKMLLYQGKVAKHE